MFSLPKQSNTIQTYNKKVRTLFTFYTIAFNLLFTIVAIVLTVIICKSRAISSVEANTSEYAYKVNSCLSKYSATVETTANMIESCKNLTQEELVTLLSDLGKTSSYDNVVSMYVAFSNTILSSSSKKFDGGTGYNAQDWYVNAIKSPSNIIVSTSTIKKESYVIFSKELTYNGESCVLGINISTKNLDDITTDFKSGKTYCFLVDNNTNIITHPNEDIKLGGVDADTLDKISGGLYRNLHELSSEDISSTTSTNDYDGSKKLTYTLPLENGWTAIGVLPYSSTYTALYIIIIIQIIITIVNIILLNTIISNKISRWFLPLLSISNKVDCLATGDLNVSFDENIVSYEIEVLANALNKTIKNLSIYINDIKTVLKNLSDCKLNVETTDCYEGDFNEIKESLDSIINNLNNVFSEINDTALGVSYNAEHMQASSQELAAGVTEQSQYIKDMFSSIEKLSVLITATAENSNQASEMAEKSSTLLAAENEDMIDLLKSMDEIKETSKQIGAIINTINEIADQTDLLALNASIEASRAGEAGKSFAVIAGEVGSLARDSAEAVKTITELITNSTKAVTKGVDIANKTAEHLSEAVAYSNDSKAMIDEITSAANTQSYEISKINSHVSQISGVTENNQAAAQENFAISDEASNQAQLLKAMVDKFDLQNS